MFDLETLSTFVEIAEAGSVSAAARRLGLPKSVVSRRLVRLEQDLGAQLIAGLGIARLPDFLIDAHIASGALKPLLVDYPPPEVAAFGAPVRRQIYPCIRRQCVDQ
jgi:DNA-binding transcriptional LysR family regulator